MIYSNITLTVTAGVSRTNERIILYRGDREVEVIFEILQSAFKFAKGENVIENTKAAFGQLIIDRPDKDFIFSEMTECEDGKVKFVITGEMIDDLGEVGLYGIQIRLYDEAKTSRITLPPVMDAIEVREPISEEPTTIDEAIIDYSMVARGEIVEDPFDDPFDDSDSYNKTNWVSGDKITAVKMNKLENAMYEVNEKVEGIAIPSLDGYATKNYVDSAIDEVDVSSQLGDYAKLSQVPTKTSQLVNDSGFLTEAPDLSNYVTNASLKGVENAYKAADTTLQNNINSLDAAYKAADTTLQNNINALDAAYKAADTTLTNKVNSIETAYKAADTTLTNKVNSIETAYKAADTTLQNNINSTSTTLTNRINTVETAYKAADTAIQNAIPTKISQLTNDSNYADKAYVDNAVDSVDVTSQLSDYAKKSVLSSYATTSFVTSQLNNLTTGSNVPTYVITEAQMVADKIIEKRNAYSLVIGSMSDLHTTGSDTSATGVLHAFQGINEIDKVTPVDLVTICGDVIVLDFDDTYEPGLRYIRTCMNEITKNVPLLHMQGNHDELPADTTEVGRQKYFAYIGANNEGTVTDFNNRYRNYGYKDFDDLRIRVIYLNSADCSDGDVTGDCWITSEQFEWIITKAFDFSDKEGADDWHIIAMCHHPLNWNSHMIYLQNILKAHKKRISGSFTHNDGKTVSYDFANVKQNFVCHIHGHIHNFRTEWFDDVISITVPNACFYRNNEYGTAYGDGSDAQIYFGDADENGVQRQFNKTSNTANDTAFVTLVIDSRVNNKIYAYCYGAGIHREIDLVSKEVTYISKEAIDVPDDTPDDVPTSQGNLLPKAIDTDGSIYNEVGFKIGWRVSGTTGLEIEDASFALTGYIPFTCGDVIRMANILIVGTEHYVWTYDSEFNPVSVVDISKLPSVIGDTSVTWDEINQTELHANAKYIRISIQGTMTSNSILTINEEITGGIITPAPELFTNLVPTSIGTDGNIYNGTGYKADYRGNSSGAETALAGAIVSGFIPYNNEVIQVYGSSNSNHGSTGYYVNFYNSSFTHLITIPGGSGTLEEVNGYYLWTLDPSSTNETQQSKISQAKYIRASMPNCTPSNFAVGLE